MCGISGVLAARGEAGRFVRGMHAVLGHRGPDGEGVESAAGALLAHRRLSILDLSPAAAQPMWDAGRRACIVYNGEIYNYRELRAECVSRGADFRSMSDTEVVLNLFLLDGEASFARLNGMFAFAIADARGGESWLVRDPAGIKPLYWAETPHGVAFASELRAFTASGIVPFDVDPEALQAYLQVDFVPAPMSIVRGVRKLPGGHRVRVRRGGAVTVEPFGYRSAGPLEPVGSDRAELDRFDRVLRDAVSRQLVADVPVGVFLSGGIDSSIVARAASDAAGRIATFSVAFDDPTFDESRWFSMAAKAVGSDHHTERLDARAMLDLLPALPEIASEPLADGSIFPTVLLARFARRHVKVALSGDGADELFAGYPTHALSVAGTAWGMLPRGVRRTVAAAAHAVLPVSHANLSFDFKVRKFLEGADRDPVVQNQQWLGSFLPEEAARVLAVWDADAQQRLVALWREASEGAHGRLEALLRTDRRFYLQDGVLVKTDRASMASALEVRVPMLDLEMIRLADSVPAHRKIRLRRSKWLLREWARKHFPPELCDRPKKGFGAPLARWFRHELRDLVRDTLAPAAVARDGFFDPREVTSLVEEHERGARDQRKRIFNLLMFTLWLRHVRPA